MRIRSAKEKELKKFLPARPRKKELTAVPRAGHADAHLVGGLCGEQGSLGVAGRRRDRLYLRVNPCGVAGETNSWISDKH